MTSPSLLLRLLVVVALLTGGLRPVLALPCALLEARRAQLARETEFQMSTLEALINNGSRAQERRFFQEAVESYRTALESGSTLQERWKSLIGKLVAEGSRSSAFQAQCTRTLSRALAQAVAIKDRLHDVHARLGQVYVEVGNHPRAAAEFGKAVKLDPNDPQLWTALGQAQLAAGQFQEAVRSLDTSLVLDPYQPEVLYSVAQAHAQLDEPGRAVHDLRRSVSRGYNQFDAIEQNPRLDSLVGDTRFEEIVYHGPASVY